MGIPNLTGLLGNVQNIANNVSLQDIFTGLATTAAGTVVVSGLQSSGGQDAIDPLHIFHHPGTAATATTPATPPSVGAVQGQVMTMTKFLSLSADQQKLISAMGFTIIPG